MTSALNSWQSGCVAETTACCLAPELVPLTCWCMKRANNSQRGNTSVCCWRLLSLLSLPLIGWRKKRESTEEKWGKTSPSKVCFHWAGSSGNSCFVLRKKNKTKKTSGHILCPPSLTPPPSSIQPGHTSYRKWVKYNPLFPAAHRAGSSLLVRSLYCCIFVNSCRFFFFFWYPGMW